MAQAIAETRWDARADIDDDGDFDSADQTAYDAKALLWFPESSPVVAQPGSDVGNPYMFQGRPHFVIDTAGGETEATLMLNDHRARFHDPVTGRWLNRDPIGYDGGTYNLYEFVASAPTYWFDPSGHGFLTWCIGHGWDAPDYIEDAARDGFDKAVWDGAHGAADSVVDNLTSGLVSDIGGHTFDCDTRSLARTRTEIFTTPAHLMVPGGGVGKLTKVCVKTGKKIFTGGPGRKIVTGAIKGATKGAKAGTKGAKGAAKKLAEKAAKEKAAKEAAEKAGKCFVAGTLILMADGSLKPIELVETGDLVFCDNDPEADNGPEIGQVLNRWQHTANELVDLLIIGDDNQPLWLTTTPEHPFYDFETGTYVRAGDLEVHDCFQATIGVAGTLVAISTRHEPTEVYNVEVGGGHNYYVSGPIADFGVLVHNKDPIPDAPKTPDVPQTPKGPKKSGVEPNAPAGGAPHRGGSASTKEKHQGGQTAKKKSRGGEKGDEGRRPPRRKPKGWKGPWPPKK